ncbi:MAG: glycosyltransferase family 39 protein [Candidatus Sumerlaeaceae bacterium]|nr:glycosyltransferase family 39 protein [Candidatus Sumerlaeaceae bacterium]
MKTGIRGAAVPEVAGHNDRGGWISVLLVILAVAYLGVAYSSLRQDSATVDEFGHIPAGHNILSTGDFGYAEFHPPLLNILSALPMAFLQLHPDTSRPAPFPDAGYSFWYNGYNFAQRFAGDYQKIVVAARVVTVVQVLLLGVLLFFWAHDFGGRRPALAGLLAAAVVWFSPGILAHSRLAALDAGIAFFMALAIWGFHRFLRCQNAGWLIVCGVLVGVAQLCKGTALYLYPILVVLAVAWRHFHEDCHFGRLTLKVAGIFLTSLVVINAGYLFQGTCTSLGEMDFLSPTLADLQRGLPAGIPVPLPRVYVESFDRQLHESATGYGASLFGVYYPEGVWYYYLALLGVKTPIPLMLLAVTAILIFTRVAPRMTFQTVLLLFPPVFIIILFSFFSGKQIGTRVLLPAAPLFWLWVSLVITNARHPRWRLGLFGILGLWMVAVDVRAYPDYLSYFNTFVRSPGQAARITTDSNLDWGQDLIRLREFMKQRGIAKVQLLYFGRVDPSIYGISYELPKGAPKPGYLVVSSTLFDRDYPLTDHGRIVRIVEVRLDRNPKARRVGFIGRTLQLYEISE